MSKIKIRKSKGSDKPDPASSGSDDLVDFLIEQVNKKVGPEAIMKLSDTSKKAPVIFSSGVPRLDEALGIGGYPSGRIMEILGPESSGKTTICLHAAAACQRAGGIVSFIDAEHALDLNYARQLGVDTSKLLLTQPDSGEQVFSVLETLLKSKKEKNLDRPLLIIADSVAAMIPQSELDGEEVGDGALGAHARLMSQGLKRLCSIQKGTNSLVFFTNQIRHKIGVRFGNPETTPGGNALKFYASIRIDIRSIGKEKVGDDVVANRTRIKIIKNKLAPPFKEFETEMRFGIGIDLFLEKMNLLQEQGKIVKNGAWFSIKDGDKLGCGINAVRELYGQNPSVIDNLMGA